MRSGSSTLYFYLGLYRIYFFQYGRSWILPELDWEIWPELDFQTDCNFTNLMCKNITNVRVIWVFDYFLCSSYRYDFLNFWICYLFKPIRLSCCSFNVSGKSTFQIRQNYPAPVGFFAGAGFLPVWKSAGAKIWYIPTVDFFSIQFGLPTSASCESSLPVAISAFVSLSPDHCVVGFSRCQRPLMLRASLQYCQHWFFDALA